MDKKETKSEFEKELSNLINEYSIENYSNTPDFILAKFLNNCLNNYNTVITARDNWYDFKPFGGINVECSTKTKETK